MDVAAAVVLLLPSRPQIGRYFKLWSPENEARYYEDVEKHRTSPSPLTWLVGRPSPPRKTTFTCAFRANCVHV
jgi:hypothetical protein